MGMDRGAERENAGPGRDEVALTDGAGKGGVLTLDRVGGARTLLAFVLLVGGGMAILSIGLGIHPIADTVDVVAGPGNGGNESGAGADSLDRAELREAIHNRVNRLRVAHGKEPLTYSTDVERPAQAHAANMATVPFFNHTSPTGEKLSDRYVRYGAPCRSGGENIARVPHVNNSEEAVAKDVVGRWMASPAHRANVLSDRWRLQAIGVAWNGDDLYVVQNFC